MALEGSLAWLSRVATIQQDFGGKLGPSPYLSPSGLLLASPRDSTVELWDLATGRRVRALSENVEEWGPTDERFTQHPVYRSSVPAFGWTVGHSWFSPDERRLYLGRAYSPLLEVWGVASGQMLRIIPGYGESWRRRSLSPDGRLLLLGAEAWKWKRTHMVWDLETGHEDESAIGTVENRLHVEFRDGRLMAVGAISKEREIGELRLRVPVQDVRHVHELREVASDWLTRECLVWDTSVEWSSDYSRLATHLVQSTIVQVWDVVTGRLVHTIDCTRLDQWYGIGEMKFSPDGRRLAISGQNVAVELWDVAKGQLDHTLGGLGSTVAGIAFSPDGVLVATRGYHCVKVWEVATGRLVSDLEGPISGLGNMCFSSDGWSLAVTTLSLTGGHTSVKVWGPERPEARQQAVYDRPRSAADSTRADSPVEQPPQLVRALIEYLLEHPQTDPEVHGQFRRLWYRIADWRGLRETARKTPRTPHLEEKQYELLVETTRRKLTPVINEFLYEKMSTGDLSGLEYNKDQYKNEEEAQLARNQIYAVEKDIVDRMASVFDRMYSVMFPEGLSESIRYVRSFDYQKLTGDDFCRDLAVQKVPADEGGSGLDFEECAEARGVCLYEYGVAQSVRWLTEELVRKPCYTDI